MVRELKGPVFGRTVCSLRGVTGSCVNKVSMQHTSCEWETPIGRSLCNLGQFKGRLYGEATQMWNRLPQKVFMGTFCHCIIGGV